MYSTKQTFLRYIYHLVSTGGSRKATKNARDAAPDAA